MWRLNFLYILLLGAFLVSCTQTSSKLEIITPSGEILELTALVNKSVTGKITVKNVGDAGLSFEVKVTDDLVISTDPSKGNIGKNESVEITVNVTCPNEENTYEAKVTLETNDINKTFTIKLMCQTPKLPELVAGQWNEFQGGKDTMCANGSDYKYFAYKGNTNKLVIDFMGGGACWDDNSCPFPNSNPNPAIGQGFYDDSIPSDLSTGTTGIYDKGNSSNPTKDWYHVFAPYCTGDLHLGNNTATYKNPIDQTNVTVQHKGAVNAKAVLDWVFEEFEAPESILITGCSAGAYASIFWADAIKKQYPNANTNQLGDSAAGIVNEAFVSQVNTNWKIDNNLLNPIADINKDLVPNSYIAAAKLYTNTTFAQYNSLFDGTQTGFYSSIKGVFPPTQTEAIEWTTGMLTSLATIEGQTTNFHSYTANFNRDPQTGATPHCIIFRDELYNLKQNEVVFLDWLNDLMSGKGVQTVTAPLP